MNEKSHTTPIVIALVAGLIGGALSSWILTRTLPLNVDAIRTQNLSLVDDQGNYRASLTLSSDGYPILAMRDEKDRIRIMLGAGAAGGPYISLKDTSGISQIALRVNPSVGPHLVVMETVGERQSKVIWRAP